MKFKILALTALSYVVIFTSCMDRDVSIPRSNIKDYVEKQLGDSVSIVQESYSRLYVISSADTLPKDYTKVKTKRGEVEQWQIDYHEINGITLGISFSGFDEKIYNKVVKNDKVLRGLGPNWNGYIMLGFFKLATDTRDELSGGCFILDSLYNVKSAYDVMDFHLIYEMAKDDFNADK